MTAQSEYELTTLPDPYSDCGGCVFHMPNTVGMRCCNPYRPLASVSDANLQQAADNPHTYILDTSCEAVDDSRIYALRHKLTHQVVRPERIVRYFAGEPDDTENI